MWEQTLFTDWPNLLNSLDEKVMNAHGGPQYTVSCNHRTAQLLRAQAHHRWLYAAERDAVVCDFGDAKIVEDDSAEDGMLHVVELA
jgi:hypothetical protein